MRGTFGKIEKSTLQRYQVCTNRSINENVMALGSKGVRVVFSAFFRRKILAKPKMLSANRELHVAAEVVFFLKFLDLWINL